ncbi:MAG: class I tRNA ligase family protein, partial [Chloroflexi bacterium]|nr:class I tRNA ligase family protein [Chloroflexota bacterium]
MSTTEFDLAILSDLTGAYDASVVEDPIYAFWEDNGWFRPTDASESEAEPFSVIMPPPNVTGVLHLGHAVTLTIEDALIRWHRMLGEPTLWLPGLDHAGIATQSVVEQQLAREGMTRHDLGRDAFEERVWDWVGVTRPRITSQARRMGASCDWERTAFTLDPTPRDAVRRTFVDLFKDGKIYRGARIINWDPQMMTALSDVEVEYEEEEGHLWHVRYPFVDERGNELEEGVTIATTRPETIPADVAIAVHPD